MKKLFAILFVCMLSSTPYASAATNAAPLGLEIAAATLAEVQATVGKQTSLEAAGVNAYSGGPMLKGNGKGLGIDGLSEIMFIFDTKQVLVGVTMTLPQAEGFGDLENRRFKKTMNQLATKYKLTGKRVPFVGDAYAHFAQGNSVIRLHASHLDFTMSLQYLSKDLLKAFESQSAQDHASKDRRQASRL